MANQEHLNLLKQGVECWNQWRRQYPETQPDLSDANLNGVYLSQFDLSKTNLRQADLRGSSFEEADLRSALLISACCEGANLHGADLSFANVSEAHLWMANLSGANLSLASLYRANLSYANLNRTNFFGTRLGHTLFAWVNLCTVERLDMAIHVGPSNVNINTVSLPEDEVRRLFLRGAGFSDTFINYYSSLFTAAIQYYSCFISYSSKDDALAKRLYADLQTRGVRCWFAPEDMKIGNKIRNRIDKAIHVQDKLLLLLSRHALASEWVEDEVEIAFRKEREQKRDVLFPVRLDESVMQASQAWAKKLRDTRHIGDFTNWTDSQAYEKAFDRLLRDLRKADEQECEDGGH